LNKFKLVCNIVPDMTSRSINSSFFRTLIFLPQGIMYHYTLCSNMEQTQVRKKTLYTFALLLLSAIYLNLLRIKLILCSIDQNKYNILHNIVICLPSNNLKIIIGIITRENFIETGSESTTLLLFSNFNRTVMSGFGVYPFAEWLINVVKIIQKNKKHEKRFSKTSSHYPC